MNEIYFTEPDNEFLKRKYFDVFIATIFTVIFLISFIFFFYYHNREINIGSGFFLLFFIASCIALVISIIGSFRYKKIIILKDGTRHLIKIGYQYSTITKETVQYKNNVVYLFDGNKKIKNRYIGKKTLKAIKDLL